MGLTCTRGPASLRFGVRLRLSEEREFRALLKARRRVQTEYFSVHVLSNELSYARLGIVAAKRVAPRAVDRNFAKRVVRERFRRNQGHLAGLDVLVRVRRRVLKEQGRVAGDELTNLFCRLIS